jgi:hypothetical protein
MKQQVRVWLIIASLTALVGITLIRIGQPLLGFILWGCGAIFVSILALRGPSQK